ncbi:MAG: FAD-binding oxidoreductase [Rhizomicrobium sp.]|nr:FAD-binding oxidoreductase [Rhizomicrobium sp.]
MSQDRSKLRWNGWGWAARKDELAQRDDVWVWLAAELGMPALLATPARPLEEISLPPGTLALPHRLELSAIVGASQLRESIAERAFHTRGRSYRDLLHLRAGDLAEAPDAVIYPRGTDEVLAILAVAATRRIAVIPFGGGTSLESGVAAIRGECESVITLDLSEMDRIIAIDTVSNTAEVEAGIYGPALESALKAKGLTLDCAPQANEFSTLGGWIAARPADPFGPPPRWLCSVKLATPTGLINTGQRGAGPDMTNLVLGSEGQFGIITEATIGLKPLPAECHRHTYLFADFSSGLAALRAIHQEGCSPVMLRLCDSEETRVLGTFEQLGKRRSMIDRLSARFRAARGTIGQPCQMIAGFEGDAATIAFQRHRLEAVARRYHGIGQGRSEGSQHFQGPYIRDSLLERGMGVETFEVSARWSNLQSVYESTRAGVDAALRETAPRESAHGIVLCHVAAAAPSTATLAFTAIFPRAIGADLEQADKIEAAALQAMLEAGGVPHRGSGWAKGTSSQDDNRESAVAVWRAVKLSLDPKDVLAPGKAIS